MTHTSDASDKDFKPGTGNTPYGYLNPKRVCKERCKNCCGVMKNGRVKENSIRVMDFYYENMRNNNTPRR
jgi:hypothetical protein